MPAYLREGLSERISGFPTPVAGLALGITGLGLAWENLLPGTWLAEITATVAALLLMLLSVRFVLHPATLSRDLADPVVGGVVATYAMGWMLVSISLWQVSHVAGTLLWLFGLGVHLVFLALFARHRMVRFEWTHMVPSWFVPPVGIITAAVSYRGPHEGPLFSLAVAALYFGMITYALMLPAMFYRFIFAENVEVTAMPTLAILAAPASLSLTGYLALVDDPQPLPVILLMGISVLMTTIVYVAFVRLLALPFSPGFSAYTFPLAIGATALFKAAEQLEAWQVRQKLINQTHGLAVFELLVATALVAYVIVRFSQFAWTNWWMTPGKETPD
jgi:tellurite resistance protein TehA-like permease